MEDFSAQFLETQKQRLIEIKADLLAQGERNKSARDTVELDQTSVGRLSRMDALQSQAMAQETDRRRLLQIKRVEAALARIKNGDYGYCVQSGEPISLKRLELDPAAPTAVIPSSGSDKP